MAEVKTPKMLLSRAETAAATGLSQYEVGKLIDGGHLRTLKVGKNVRVHRASLDAFIAGNLEAARA